MYNSFSYIQSGSLSNGFFLLRAGNEAIVRRTAIDAPQISIFGRWATSPSTRKQLIYQPHSHSSDPIKWDWHEMGNNPRHGSIYVFPDPGRRAGKQRLQEATTHYCLWARLIIAFHRIAHFAKHTANALHISFFSFPFYSVRRRKLMLFSFVKLKVFGSNLIPLSILASCCS